MSNSLGPSSSTYSLQIYCLGLIGSTSNIFWAWGVKRVLKLLIRGFPCCIFNFLCTQICSYKFWNNIHFSLIFFPTKKQKSLIQLYYLTYKKDKKKKKPLISPPISIQMFDSYLYLLSIWIQTSIIFIKKIQSYFLKKKKKKDSLPHLKTTNCYPKISMIFF